LRGPRRQIPKIVQSALTNGDDLGRCGQRGKLCQRRLIELGGVMRMNARRAAEALRVAADQLDRGARAWQRAAGDQHVRDASVSRAPDYVRSIAVETVVGEIDADIDERGGQWSNLRQRQPVLSFRP